MTRRGRAFTLFESLLVLGLVALLAGSIFGFMWNMSGRRDALLRESSSGRAATALMERIESDLLGGMVGSGDVGPGVQGERHRIRLLSRGVVLPTSASPRPDVRRDLQATECVFDRGSGEVRLRRWNIGDASETPLDTLCGRVQWMALSYFDGQDWAASFDSLRQGNLPVAVEIALWFGDPAAQAEDVPDMSLSAAGSADESGADEFAGASGLSGDEGRPSRAPDRTRIIVVPDGPVSSWKEAR